MYARPAKYGRITIISMAGTILLLDDDQTLLDVMTQTFKLLYERDTVTATSLAMLLEAKAGALATTIAFLDINLGANQPSGIDAYHWLKQNDYQGCIIFFTGHAKTHPLVAEASKL